MDEQLEDLKKQAAEDYHAILFMYLADQQHNGKRFEDIQNAVLRKKDPFPKSISDACRLLTSRRNNYGVDRSVLRQMMEWILLL